MRYVLWDVRDEDLAVLFEQWVDPLAARMAAYRAPDHMNRDALSAAGSKRCFASTHRSANNAA